MGLCNQKLCGQTGLVHQYLQFLHSLFKSEESKAFIALAYIIEILPIKKIQDESARNNISEHIMLSAKPVTKYYEFTEDEVQQLCTEYDMDFDSVKEWYDGYQIDGFSMYNPNFVYRAMVNHELFWGIPAERIRRRCLFLALLHRLLI